MAADDPRQALGREGERLAERFLRKLGFRTLARRYNTPVGELDLVMRDGETIAFVEVKTRRDRSSLGPEEDIRPGQHARMTRAARWYLRRANAEDRPCRFDVVSVEIREQGPAKLQHFPDAYPPADRR